MPYDFFMSRYKEVGTMSKPLADSSLPCVVLVIIYSFRTLLLVCDTHVERMNHG